MDTLTRLYLQWQQETKSLPDAIQEAMERQFMIAFNYNSNHIEGNTLTYGQTELLLLYDRVSGRGPMRDFEEMKAHNLCLGLIECEGRSIDKRPLTEVFIRLLHKTLLREDYTVYHHLPDGTPTSYLIHAGIYKTRPNSVVTVTGERFEYASPEETPALMTDLVDWYNTEDSLSPIEKATLFHYRYIRIHPFEDGNGRIARLLSNYILLRNGYPMVIIPNTDRETYLHVLNLCDIATGSIPCDGAHATITQIKPFVEYLRTLMVKTLRQDIRFIEKYRKQS